MHSKYLSRQLSFAGRRQGGAINLLMVTLVGTAALAVTAMTLNAIRGAQDQQLALHANSQASARAWDGVELLRHYFSAASDDDLVAFEICSEGSPCALSVSGVQGISAAVVAFLDGPESPSGRRRIVANVRGSGAHDDGEAHTSVTVQAIYEFLPPTPGNPEDEGGAGEGVPAPLVKISSDLNLTGSINVLGGESANLVVDGNVTMSGSVSGINELCATGNLSISSAINVQRICSNGNVTLTGAATTSLVEATGNVSLSGGAATNIGTILANGDVSLSGGSANAGTLRTQGNVSVTGGSARVTGTVDAEGSVNWTSSNSASLINANQDVTYRANGAATINSRGNVTLSGNGNVQNLNAYGQVFLQSGYGLGVSGQLRGGSGLTFNQNTRVQSGVVRGAISPNPASVPSWAPVMNVVQDPALELFIPEVSVPDVRPVEVPESTVDVYALKNSANYVFEIEPATGNRRVTVRNVSGIADGVYYLGNYPDGKMDYLCDEVQLQGGSAACTAPPVPGRTICQGFSAYNGCFTFDSVQQRWEINGQTMAPGVAWFDGNLNVGNGRYINTFLATGAISTSGSLVTYAPNYAGYTGVCTDNRSSFGVSPIDQRLSGLYPANLCVAGTYVPASLANVAFIAGGYRNGIYGGGNISLGASNFIYGSVIAGGLLTTGGDTSVVGSIEIANMTRSASPTSWSGSTTIDLRNLPETFNPNPGCLVDCPDPTDPDGSGGTLPWRVFWTRYL